MNIDLLPNKEEIQQKVDLMQSSGFSNEIIEQEIKKMIEEAFKTMKASDVAKVQNPEAEVLSIKSVPQSIIKGFSKNFSKSDLNKGTFLKVYENNQPKYLFIPDESQSK